MMTPKRKPHFRSPLPAVGERGTVRGLLPSDHRPLTTDHCSTDPCRRGITLSEILISILVMAIGLVSLPPSSRSAWSLRQARRNTRSTLLYPAALADIDAKQLLNRRYFDAMPWYGYFPHTAGTGIGYDPWVQDLPLPSGATATSGGQTYLVDDGGAYRGKGVTYRFATGDVTEFPKTGEGLPVCYDPLWWSVVNGLDSTVTPLTQPLVSRFGRSPAAGVVAPTTGASATPPSATAPPAPTACPASRTPSPSAHSSSPKPSSRPTTASCRRRARSPRSPSPTPPATPTSLSSKATRPCPRSTSSATLGAGNLLSIERTFDYSFSWMFTGRRSRRLQRRDLRRRHRRSSTTAPSPSTSAPPTPRRRRRARRRGDLRLRHRRPGRAASTARITTTVGYSHDQRTVLLRWPLSQPDPDVRVGGWIADVTYERTKHDRFARFGPGPAEPTYPGQRCHWYRVVRRGEPSRTRSSARPPPRPTRTTGGSS